MSVVFLPYGTMTDLCPGAMTFAFSAKTKIKVVSRNTIQREQRSLGEKREKQEKFIMARLKDYEERLSRL